MIKQKDGKYTIDMDIFIIPDIVANGVGSFPKSCRETVSNFWKKIDKLNNNYSFNENDQYIGICGVERDDGVFVCGNLCKYPIIVEDADGNHWDSRIQEENWPASLLRGRKEGENFNMVIPLTLWSRKTEGISKEVCLEATITCKQKGSRYTAFGKFEEAIEFLIGK